MLSPDDLIDAQVAAIASIPAFDAYGVGGYKDKYPAQTNVRMAVLGAPPGTVLVVYQGTGVRRVGNVAQFAHRFSWYLRTLEAPDALSYGALFAALVNGKPTGSVLPLLRYTIHAGCNPIDVDLPQAQRNQLLISADGQTMDYFEVLVSLVEIGEEE